MKAYTPTPKSTILVLIALAFFSLNLKAQVMDPVSWKFSSEMTGENEAELIFKASIDMPWHLYSAYIPEGGPIATRPYFDESEAFVRSVLGSTEDVWERIFRDSGREYPKPTLVLFTDSTNSACGGATSRIGPHYCPVDRTIYIDRDFFRDLEVRFGASGGDFAEAYVIAHEVAHHVQHTLGIMDEMRAAQQSDPGTANALSVSLELQADCFAGVWASRLVGVLEPGDIQEGLDAAAAVGDDRIQETMTGRVNPESWTHGSSQQRVDWFTAGYETGDPNTCDTF